MSRLIDVDKAENDIVENVTTKAVSRVVAILQGQPTVKAIPIEWLEMQLDVFGDGFYDLRLVIKHWEKENQSLE